jgi:hypothetical protein
MKKKLSSEDLPEHLAPRTMNLSPVQFKEEEKKLPDGGIKYN